MTGRSLWVLALAALPACRAWPTPPAVPALVTQATAASRADLELAVSQALGGTPVRLAHDALTHDSLLIVGRAQARALNGVPLNGRELGRPQHFRLLEQGSRCVLLHLETGQSRVLPHTSCHASPEGNSRT
ncbi:MAG: hypothetical protein ACREV7_14335 [Steroidobacteraceae bacterium]